MEKNAALITNDAVVLGILMLILAFVFKTSSSDSPGWKKFYTYVPSLLLCYFIPAIFNTLGIISGETSDLYFVASRYLLPTSLVLLTLSIDLKGILRLGPKAVIMFLTGTVGIIIGGPLAIIIVSLFAPDIVGGVGADEVWRGLATVAGSWIGGGANQAAMFEVFGASTDLFAAMIAVDVIVANLWMAFLLYGAGRSGQMDKTFRADASAIESLKNKIENYRKEFIGDISHELKTPIFAIQGFIETLLNGAIHDKNVNEVFLKKTMRNVNRLIYLTNDLMEISRLETGELKSNIKEMYLRDVVLDRVVCRARQKGGQVLVSIKDTGIGIEKKDLKRVTERFFRVDKSRSRERGGTGLGLAIVKHIVEAHGEKLFIESSPEEGSTFSITLTKSNPVLV